MAETTQLHATAVDIGGNGVLIRGPSGSGKSDLALRLIEGSAMLVSDDRTDLEVENGRLLARAPENLAGLLEVRGVGIVELEIVPRTPLALVVDLVASDRIERLPAPTETEILGVALPSIRLAPFEVGAPAKLRLALDVVRGNMKMRHGITN